MVIATNLNYIFCVYEEKIVKNNSYWRAYASTQIQKVAIFEPDD